ncbi:XRE family transcriptional regulator [Alloactinosynnema sp. L-07]|uniref:XRE family transcriptional regulator n=1 Tax=Alloactinosynnema sp. L-07 TaxID=1653480 RepID=UPI0012F790AB|nr:XRE family transcriptional regulator [Alloactinosynnema sp. L-07]
MPYPHAQAALERMFGEPVTRLFGPPYGHVITPATVPMVPLRGNARTDWEGQVISMCADRAREFLIKAEASNVGSETMDQVTDDVRRLVTAYQQVPLERILGDMADTQTRVFALLERRQRPDQMRDLYLLAGVASGLMARASHDLGAPHDAMTQARAAYACADNAGHNGLRAWTRGLQTLIAYWSGDFTESARYAELGIQAADHTTGTAAVWLASGQARTLAALNRIDEARQAIERARDARDRVVPDELDSLGGVCTFSHPRQLYYAADALTWGGKETAAETDRLATEALTAYAMADDRDRAFGDEAGTRCDLAIARTLRGEFDGAGDALKPVLAMPPSQRTHGVMASIDYVRRAIPADAGTDRTALGLRDAIEVFTAERLAIPG